MKSKQSVFAAFVAFAAAAIFISLILPGAAHAASSSITGYFVVAEGANEKINESNADRINASVSGAGAPGKIPGITGAAVGPGMDSGFPDLISLFKGIFLKFFPWFS
ncbi:MAG: hypothetical protein NT001_06540 [Candidatus Woesearchaeota archaeon]|nr:hypothetical protein [Candidatus Woesearchaeota archaeon]